jgi:hypothetical protein
MLWLQFGTRSGRRANVAMTNEAIGDLRSIQILLFVSKSYRDYLFIYQSGIVAGAQMIGISIIWKEVVVKRPLLRWSHASSSCDHGPMGDMLCFTV